MTVVESAQAAVDDGRAALADLPQVGWRVGPGGEGARRAARRTRTSSWPTRRARGWAGTWSTRWPRTGPPRIVYVACDPASLARDLALFADRGYRLGALRAFDAFPMTHHMECVALLQRAA